MGKGNKKVGSMSSLLSPSSQARAGRNQSWGRGEGIGVGRKGKKGLKGMQAWHRGNCLPSSTGRKGVKEGTLGGWGQVVRKNGPN